MSVVDVVAEHFVSAGVLAEWSCFRGFEPPNPDKTVTVIEFSGTPPETTFKADYPSFQVRVRGAPWEYEVVQQKAIELLNSIHGASPVMGTSVSPVDYLVYVMADHQPFPADRDDLDRTTFVFNCRSMRA